MILLYQDYVHNNGVLHRALCDHFGPENVRFCDAAAITGGIPETARMLVMPGGADLYYCEKLNGAGNRAIRDFVEGGGAYLGICAGAYYACTNIAWAKDTDAAICGSRELRLYKGAATGPVYDFIEDGHIEKSWDAAVSLTCDGEDISVLYGGGPIFSGDPDAEVLARYAALPGSPAAIVRCAVGKGTAILCGPHIEYDAAQYESALYRHRNPSYTWEKEVLRKMEQGDRPRQKLRRDIFDNALPGF